MTEKQTNPESPIKTEKRGHVLLIGFNRPAERNAMNHEMLIQFSDAYTRLEREDDLRVGVVYAEGKHFSLGLDLPDIAGVIKTERRLPIPEGNIDPFDVTPGARRTKPVIVAVHGCCFTLGIELCLAADIRLAATRTRFAQLEVQRGLMPFGGATMRMPAAFGWGNAMRYLLTGDDFDANEALRLGLVQEVVEKPRLLDRAVELAERIAEQAPLAVYATRASAVKARNQGDEAAVDGLLPAVLDLLEAEDFAEGERSFVEKRKARFQGK